MVAETVKAIKRSRKKINESDYQERKEEKNNEANTMKSEIKEKIKERNRKHNEGMRQTERMRYKRGCEGKEKSIEKKKIRKEYQGNAMRNEIKEEND